MKTGILIRDARKKKEKTNPKQSVLEKKSYISRIQSDETNSINIKTLTEIVRERIGWRAKIKILYGI